MYFQIFVVIIICICICIYYNSNKINLGDTNEGFSNKIKNFKKNKNNFKNIKSRGKGEKFKDTDREDFYNVSENTMVGSLTENYKKVNYDKLIKNNDRASMSSFKNRIYNYYKRFDNENFTRESKSVIDSLGKWKYFKKELFNIFET